MDVKCHQPLLMDPSPSYLIVGAGIFGASTALHLKQSSPSASITLIDMTDYPSPIAASHDVNKIIRADYRDIVYTGLALEAQELWRSDPLYKSHYHETGIVFADNLTKMTPFLENFKCLGVDPGATLLSVQEACDRFPELQGANWTGVERVYYNPRAGWGEAQHALRDVIQSAVDCGVVFHEALVDKILLDQDGRCAGVSLSTAEDLLADHVILCTGARTAKLLADSFPERIELQAQGRLVAAGAVCCTVKVPEDQRINFQSAPVMANVMPHTRGSCKWPCVTCSWLPPY
jgi:sarcosine oxidase/L-pipecolate oxidase